MTAQTIDTGHPLELGEQGYSTMPDGLTPAERHAYHVGFARGERAYMKKNGGPGVVHDGAAPAAGSAAHKMLARTLAESGRAYRIARHPQAHKGGMAAIGAYLRKCDKVRALGAGYDVTPGAPARLSEIIDPMAPAKPASKAPRKTRKPAARIIGGEKPAAPVTEPVDVVTAARESGRLTVVHVTDTPGSDHGITAEDLAAAGIPGGRVERVTPESVPAPMPKMSHAARKASNRELAAAMRAAGVKVTADTWTAAKSGADLATLVGV